MHYSFFLKKHVNSTCINTKFCIQKILEIINILVTNTKILIVSWDNVLIFVVFYSRPYIKQFFISVLLISFMFYSYIWSMFNIITVCFRLLTLYIIKIFFSINGALYTPFFPFVFLSLHCFHLILFIFHLMLIFILVYLCFISLRFIVLYG